MLLLPKDLPATPFRRLLRLSDQVKFARRPAESSEAAARIAETREIAAAVERPMPGNSAISAADSTNSGSTLTFRMSE